jgi:hypothetical protein
VCSDADKSWEREVGEGETGKQAKATPHVGVKSMSEKSQATHTSKNPIRKSSSQNTQYFVRVVKDNRTGKNGAEFFIGWRELC